MNHEHEQDRVRSRAAATTHNDTVEPGRSSRSAVLHKPAHPAASGLVQRKAGSTSGSGTHTLTDPSGHGAPSTHHIANSGTSGSHDVSATAAPRAENKTGLPDDLKSGIEFLSGISMDSVKVHYNSNQPVQLNALAYAQGSDIHVGPGQEQHLPHEVWHVVQQAQGRVKPTVQRKDGVPINDDEGLEAEADVMGARALGLGEKVAPRVEPGTTLRSGTLRSDAPAQGMSPVGMTVTPPLLTAGALHAAHGEDVGNHRKNLTQLKLNVTYSNKEKKWDISGRPEFRSFVRKTVCEKWNTDNPSKQPYDHKTINLSEEELDQCHITSWEVIRGIVTNFLNNAKTADFVKHTDGLYGQERPDDYSKMQALRDKVVGAVDSKSVPSQADVQNLCSYLNSATPNLRLDDHNFNIKIQGHSDPHLVEGDHGVTMTPNSRKNAKINMPLKGPRKSKGGANYLTSSLGGTKVNPSSLTPRTRKIYAGDVRDSDDSSSDVEDLQDPSRVASSSKDGNEEDDDDIANEVAKLSLDKAGEDSETSDSDSKTKSGGGDVKASKDMTKSAKNKSSSKLTGHLNVCTATEEDLKKLPGIGKTRAKKLYDHARTPGLTQASVEDWLKNNGAAKATQYVSISGDSTLKVE